MVLPMPSPCTFRYESPLGTRADGGARIQPHPARPLQLLGQFRGARSGGSEVPALLELPGEQVEGLNCPSEQVQRHCRIVRIAGAKKPAPCKCGRVERRR